MPVDDYRLHRTIRFSLFLLMLLAQSVITSAQSEGGTQLDLFPPQIRVAAPQEGSILQDSRPRIEVRVIDLDSGIEAKGLLISIDGIDVTADASLQSPAAEVPGCSREWLIYYRPPIPLAPGIHQIRVEAVDLAGNRSHKQWSFSVLKESPQVKYSLNLTNSANYSFFPLRRLKNVSNIALGLTYPQSRLQISARVGAADYPNPRAKLNFGGLYFTLDRYALEAQVKKAVLQYGHIGLPMESRLLQFGPGFKGSVLKVGNPSSGGGQLRVFRGTAVGSLGLGVSAVKMRGGWYERQRGQGGTKIYLVGLDGGERAIGLQAERVIGMGLLFSEIVYGQKGERGGAGLRLQAAAPFAGIFWDGDLILVQSSFPLANKSFLSHTDGGGCRGSITGTKLFKNDTVLGFGFSRQADNLWGREPETRKNQTMHLSLAGTAGADVGWHMGYQSGRTSYYGDTIQQQGRFGLRWQGQSAWNTSLTIGRTRRAGAENQNIRYQWDLGSSSKVERLGLNITSLVRCSRENTGDGVRKSSFKLRFMGEKTLLEDLLTGLLLVELGHNRQEKTSLSAQTTLSAEGTIDLTPGKHHLLQLNGRLTFWHNKGEREKRGMDYNLRVLWRAVIF